MIRPICKDVLFLTQKAVLATQADLPVVNDLLDTLKANEEGCLSLTGVRTRYQSIVVELFDQDFNKQKQTFTEWTAQIIQHEIDHCDGILI